MIEVPITKGIAGNVARPGQPLNIPDAYFRPMFNPESDQRTGDRMRIILCLPILDREGGLFDVVPLLTKRGGPLTAEAAARWQECLCPLGTTLDPWCRLAHLGRASAYA